jgi:YVTN family beta-propeller protein
MWSLRSKLLAVLLLSCSSLAISAQTVKGHIKFAKQVAGIAANPQTNRIYVVAPSFGGPSDALAVIDGASDTVIASIKIPTGAYLPAVNVFTNKVYVASCNTFRNPSPCFVSVIDATQNKVLETIPITTTPGNGIQGIAVDSTSDKIFIANASDGVIDVIDGRTNKVTDTLGISSGSPFGITFNPFNGRLYVPLGNSHVDVMDCRTKNLLSTIESGKANTYAAVDWNTNQVFVADVLHGSEAGDHDEEEAEDEELATTTTVLNLRGKVVAHIFTTDVPDAIEVDSSTGLVFEASNASHTLAIINGNTHAVSAVLRGIYANFIAVNMATGKLYLSGEGGVTIMSEK